MDNLISFNINDAVLVRLTEHGRRILDAQKATNGYANYAEDGDGWSRWQLWVLASIFGDYLSNGCVLPFETCIRFEVRTGQ